MKVIVLGAGRVGRVITEDLAQSDNLGVSVADVSLTALERVRFVDPIAKHTADLSDSDAIKELVQPFDLVVNALPGSIGYRALSAIVEAGRNCVDIAFFAEDPTELVVRAQEQGITVVYDCGVAPGMSNLLIGRISDSLKELETVEIYVGGLPVERAWPYEYKAVFSPADVIEEYVRPARLVENGELVIRPALSEPELIDFPGIGTLEAFNTDGLRSLATTIQAPNMREKTMRYPGHRDLMAVLRETGFFEDTPLEVKGHSVRPIDLTSSLLFEHWQLKEGEEDVTVMRVDIIGRQGGKRKRYRYDLFDRYDAKTEYSSMSRTTGFTACALVHELRKGTFSESGVFPPELLGPNQACFDGVLSYLSDRGVHYEVTVEELS